MDLAASARRAPQPSAGGYRRPVVELAQLVRRPAGPTQGVRFGTAHFHVALQHWVTLGLCRRRRRGKGANFAVQWTVVLPLPHPVYDPAAQHQYEGSGGRHAKHRHRVRQGGRPCRSRARRARRRHGRPVEAPTASIPYRTAMATVQAKGAPTSFEVCVLVCYWVNFCRSTFNFSIASAKTKIKR